MRELFLLVFLFSSLMGMEQSVSVVPQTELFDTLPTECTVNILGYLYEPNKNSGTRQIIRFLRTAKKFYQSEMLAAHIMHLLQGLNKNDPGKDRVYQEFGALAELGTPTAMTVFKNSVSSSRDMWKVHVLFGYMLALDERRKACILQFAGADLNADYGGMNECSVFLELAKHYYPDAKNIQKFLEAGADINSTDAYGSNILIHIIRNVEEQHALYVVRLLIQKGIHINHLTVAGRSAAAIAQINGKYLIQREIEDAGGKNIS